jgi:hypothetical protein
VTGVEHALAPADTPLFPALVFRNPCEIVGEKLHVAPFPQQRRDLFGQLQFIAVIRPRRFWLLKLDDPAMGQKQDVHPAPEQRIK